MSDLLSRVRGRWRAPFRRLPRRQYSRFNRSLPEADKWDLSAFVVHSLVPIVGVRPYPLDELLLMCSTVAYFKPGIIIEWGTHLGISARIFYEITRYLRVSVPIHSIDLPSDSAHVENIRDLAQRGRYVKNTPVRLHQGDGLPVARELHAEAKGVLPLIFLDGDHNHETVSRELNGLREFNEHTVTLVHDTFLQGPEAGYNCGPHEAVSQFAKEHACVVYSTCLGLPGMSLMYW